MKKKTQGIKSSFKELGKKEGRQVILQQSTFHLNKVENRKKTTADEILIFTVKKPKGALIYDRQHFLYFVKIA
jgi:hypothetical protein